MTLDSPKTVQGEGLIVPDARRRNGHKKGHSAEPRLFNRELSWVEFNRRVLNEAMDDSLPLLERLKFLAIFSTNLDEFFMIRVSGLKEQIAEGVGELSADGMTASEQLDEIYKRLRPMRKQQAAYLRESVVPALKPLHMARLHDGYRDSARVLLEPWLVEAALSRLGERRLSPEQQRTIVKASRTPHKVRWPEWWSERRW